MKNLLAKKNVLLCASILSAVVTFLSLVFCLFYATFMGTSNGQNGFDAIKGEEWEMAFGSGLAVFSKILAIVIIVAAVCLIAYAIFAYIKGMDMGKVSLIIVCVSIVIAIVYLIDGIVLKGKLANDYVTYHTAAFWPLIIQAVLACGTIVAGKLMKD
ncbi:MAG: hypothetical protein SPL13_01290 [Clostridia bacterium]|nr:hypothetical protein [Clostridia bacterium]